ncbi:PspC domain-containing protein [Candidatus Woesearchaeota archaeon]|nr:PspC domain-containing protein [Candidatus Woesearchaeota archaeon]
MKRLYRSRTNRVFAGVCGGIGEYMGVDPTVIRVIAIVIILASVGTGLLGYLLMWLVIPERPVHR